MLLDQGSLVTEMSQKTYLQSFVLDIRLEESKVTSHTILACGHQEATEKQSEDLCDVSSEIPLNKIR